MASPTTACILVADVPGTDRLADALGATEAGHAIERCLHRIERAADANGGRYARRGSTRLCAQFARADAAILAACEMLERVQALPPLRGLRMAIRIGIHAGEAAEPAVEQLAARLTEATPPGHALATDAVTSILGPGARQLTSAAPLRNPALAGIGTGIYAVGRQGAPTPPTTTRPQKRLHLRHRDTELVIDDLRPVVLFGRELGNDVVIADPRASRQHARIERQRDGFVLIDQSTNGTFLLEDGRVEYCVKNESVPLKGPGRIGCGFSCNEIERDLVFFEIR